MLLVEVKSPGNVSVYDSETHEMITWYKQPMQLFYKSC